MNYQNGNNQHSNNGNNNNNNNSHHINSNNYNINNFQPSQNQSMVLNGSISVRNNPTQAQNTNISNRNGSIDFLALQDGKSNDFRVDRNGDIYAASS